MQGQVEQEVDADMRIEDLRNAHAQDHKMQYGSEVAMHSAVRDSTASAASVIPDKGESALSVLTNSNEDEAMARATDQDRDRESLAYHDNGSRSNTVGTDAAPVTDLWAE